MMLSSCVLHFKKNLILNEKFELDETKSLIFSTDTDLGTFLLNRLLEQ